MSNTVGGYGFPPNLGTTRATSDRSRQEADQEQAKESKDEGREQATKKEPGSKRPFKQGIGDNVDLEA